MYNLGGFLTRKRPSPNLTLAEAYYRTALAHHPRHCPTLGYLSELHLTTGNATAANATALELCAACGGGAALPARQAGARGVRSFRRGVALARRLRGATAASQPAAVAATSGSAAIAAATAAALAAALDGDGPAHAGGQRQRQRLLGHLEPAAGGRHRCRRRQVARDHRGGRRQRDHHRSHRCACRHPRRDGADLAGRHHWHPCRRLRRARHHGPIDDGRNRLLSTTLATTRSPITAAARAPAPFPTAALALSPATLTVASAAAVASAPFTATLTAAVVSTTLSTAAAVAAASLTATSSTTSIPPIPTLPHADLERQGAVPARCVGRGGRRGRWQRRHWRPGRCGGGRRGRPCWCCWRLAGAEVTPP